MTEHDLVTVNGLVAQHGWLRRNGGGADALFGIERMLLFLCNLHLDHEVGPPDPHAPPGGTTVALRKVA